MNIVLIDWHIVADKEQDFLQYWRSELTIADRSKMIGEFLSKVTSNSVFPWITWDLKLEAGVSRFINVGLWADTDAFHDQVAKYFKPSGLARDFEYRLRQRALLDPTAWRMGGWPLPKEDSEGVI